MSIVYGLLPASSLLYSIPYRCVPEPKTWIPPEKVRGTAWIILAITTGISGLELYKINDQEASTIYIALVFFFGTGWAITNRLCNQYTNLLYSILLLFTSLWLYNRLGDFKSASSAKRARFWLWPLLLWLSFSTVLSSIALGAKLFYKHAKSSQLKFSV